MIDNAQQSMPHTDADSSMQPSCSLNASQTEAVQHPAADAWRSSMTDPARQRSVFNALADTAMQQSCSPEAGQSKANLQLADAWRSSMMDPAQQSSPAHAQLDALMQRQCSHEAAAAVAGPPADAWRSSMMDPAQHSNPAHAQLDASMQLPFCSEAAESEARPPADAWHSSMMEPRGPDGLTFQQAVCSSQSGKNGDAIASNTAQQQQGLSTQAAGVEPEEQSAAAALALQYDACASWWTQVMP